MSEARVRAPALLLSCETSGTSSQFSELVHLENGGSEISHLCKSNHQVNADGGAPMLGDSEGNRGTGYPPQGSVSLPCTQLGSSPALLLTPHPGNQFTLLTRQHPLHPSNLPHRLLLGALPLTVSRGCPGAGEGWCDSE